MQKRIVNLVLQRLLIRLLRVVEAVHVGIQSDEIGEGGCAARIKTKILKTCDNCFFVLS